tara:strand:+ start:738 stop:1205 length:468 start_codon:yes stop_codon:yes gene_type:complete
MESQEEFIESINQLLRQSFGDSYRGNYLIEWDSFEADSILMGNPNQQLSLIARRLLPIVDPIKKGRGIVGMFEENEVQDIDGSVVSIRDDRTIVDRLLSNEKSKYERLAEKYASLYESKYGAPVTIRKKPIQEIISLNTFSIERQAETQIRFAHL